MFVCNENIYTILCYYKAGKSQDIIIELGLCSAESRKSYFIIYISFLGELFL